MTGRFTVPTQEQSARMRQAGVDPDGMAILLADEDKIVCMNLRTRDEVSIYLNKCVRRTEHGN